MLLKLSSDKHGGKADDCLFSVVLWETQIMGGDLELGPAEQAYRFLYAPLALPHGVVQNALCVVRKEMTGYQAYTDLWYGRTEVVVHRCFELVADETKVIVA